MASRSGGSTGLVVSLVLTIMLAVGMFITTVIYFSNAQKAQKDLVALQSQYREYILPEEQQRDDIRQFVQAARAESKSAVAYLATNLQDTIQTITGRPRESVEAMKQKLAGVGAGSGTSLLQIIRDNGNEIARLEQQLAAANQARDRALADRENEVRKVQQIEERHAQTLAGVMSQIESYKNEADAARAAMNRLQQQYVADIERLTREHADQIASLNQQVAAARTETARLTDEVKRLRGEKRSDVLSGTPEEALVDGRIINVNANAGEVTIDRGWSDRIKLGMTFAVYSRASAITRDEEGNYAQPKARIEVIRVGDTSSTARVTFQGRGNPVIRGDVIANAVYDPNKTYKFVTFGDFDANGDGVPTPTEVSEVRRLIQAWGGEVLESIQGDVDFLVLGARPVPPPQPPIDAAPEVVQFYIDALTRVQQYDQLYNAAVSTAIPILNENRLKTLIGKPDHLQ